VTNNRQPMTSPMTSYLRVTFGNNHDIVSFGFRDIDDVNLSVTMTFWPLQVAMWPRWLVDSTSSKGFPVSIM